MTQIKVSRADGVGGQEPESQHEGNSLAGKTRQDGMYWTPIVGPGLSAMCWTELTLKGSPPPAHSYVEVLSSIQHRDDKDIVKLKREN